MTLRITIRKNGPIAIAADDVARVTLLDHEGNRVSPNVVGAPLALCRCGASQKQPFCDSSHLRIGFVGTEAPRTITETPTLPGQ